MSSGRQIPGKTIQERRQLWSELAKNFDRWMTLTDEELLAEAQAQMSSLTYATRELCLKMLVMDHTLKMVGGSYV